MNNTLKRLLSLFMAVTMVMTFAVVPVSAEGDGGEHLHVYAEGVCECGAAEPAGEPAETTTEETEAPTEETEAPTEETEAPTEETEAPTEETEAPTEETEAPTEETEAVCDGTENCAALTHETTCECYDWCAALGCTWEVHHADCPWGPCTLTEGCELVKGHPGECTGMDTFGMTGQGTADDPYRIDDLDTFKWFRDQVNSGNNYAGKHVKLTTGINLNNEEWTPIGNSTNPFNGCFDGGNNIISNLKISGSKNDVGLFGHTNNGEIKNFTVNNAEVSGRLNVGVVAGTPYTSKYTNITVSGMIKVDGMSYVGGVLGKNAYANLTNITVNASSGSYVNANSVENGTAYRTYVGGVVGFSGEGSHVFSNIHSNINVIGSTCDVGGIAGIAHYGNTFTNCSSSGNVTVNASDAGDAVEAGGIAGVWHNGGSQVTFNNCTYTGTLSAPNAGSVTFPNGGLVGQAYNANNTTSGKLMLNGSQEWPAPSVRIDNVGYPSLQAAIDATQTAATIIPQDNIALTETVTIPDGKTITLDLKGKNVANTALAFQVSGTLNLTNSGEAATVSGSDGVKMMENGKLTVGKNVTLTGTDCAIYSSADSVGNFTVTIDGGNVTSDSAQFSAVQFNGGNTGVTMNVISGSVTAADLGIYFACDGQLNISGGTVTGATGIVAKGGTTTISGDETQITGTGADNAYSENNSGQNSTGDALAVVKNAGYSKPTVSITGGTFTSAYGEAVASYGTDAVKRFISGGTFKTDLADDLIVLYYEQNDDGKVVEAADDVEAEVAAPEPEVAVEMDTTDKNSVIQNKANSGTDVTESLTNAVDEDTVAELVKTMETNGATDAQITMDIKLTDKDESSEEGTSYTTLTYYVKPVLETVKVTGEGEEKKTEVIDSEIIPNDKLDEDKPITFYLPIPDSVNASWAYLTHEGANATEAKGKYPIDTVEGKKQIKVESSSFSNWIIEPVYGVSADAEAQASIGTAEFFSLQDAIDHANNGDTIKLIAEDGIVLNTSVNVLAGKKVTLDLNGKIIDGTENVNIALISYGDLTVKDSSTEKTGAIKAGIGTSGNAINICGGTFTLESGSIYSKNNALLIDENAAVININGGKITAEPATRNSAAVYVSSTSETKINITNGEIVGYNGILLWNNSTINMTGGSIEAKSSVGIQGNGSHDNTEINISGAASVSGYYAAIYHPQGGELNISNNATLTGWTGVVVKGGTINISGGTISGTGTVGTYAPVSSGFIDTGDGLYVEHYDNSTNSENYGTPTVNVTGGTFTSTNGKSVASYANTSNNVEAPSKFVSGGTFSTEVPYEYCADRLVPATSGSSYTVAPAAAYVETADGTITYYATVEQAVAALDTITNEKTFAVMGSESAKDVTVDVSDANVKVTSDGKGGVNVTAKNALANKNYGEVKVNGVTYQVTPENGIVNAIVKDDKGIVTAKDGAVIVDREGKAVYNVSFVGNENTYIKGSNTSITVGTDAFVGTLQKIYLKMPNGDLKCLYDGQSLVEGVTFVGNQITLSSSFLNKLDASDNYAVVYEFEGENKRSTEAMKIKNPTYSYTADPTNPKTGDTILLPMAVMFTSAAALFVLLMNRKKRV